MVMVMVVRCYKLVPQTTKPEMFLGDFAALIPNLIPAKFAHLMNANVAATPSLA